MLNYRSASIAFFILATLVLLLMTGWREAGWLLVPLTILYVILLVLGSVKICMGFYIPAHCKINTPEKKALLTFDDGPDERFTPAIFEILDRHQVKAIFFLIGRHAENHPALVRQIADSGHGIGIHSYGHAFWFDLYGRKKMERDLQHAEGITWKITGKKPVLFRPPYGVTNPVLAKVVRKLGYKVIGWSVRSLDTMGKNAEKIAERVIRGLHPGAVILMHDTMEITPEALERIIAGAKEKGYIFARPDEWLLEPTSSVVGLPHKTEKKK